MPRHVDVERPGDVGALVLTIWGGGALGVVTALTLLVSGHFEQRWFLLVFGVPALAFLVLGAMRLVRRPRRTDGRHASGPD